MQPHAIPIPYGCGFLRQSAPRQWFRPLQATESMVPACRWRPARFRPFDSADNLPVFSVNPYGLPRAAPASADDVPEGCCGLERGLQSRDPRAKNPSGVPTLGAATHLHSMVIGVKGEPPHGLTHQPAGPHAATARYDDLSGCVAALALLNGPSLYCIRPICDMIKPQPMSLAPSS